MLSSSSRLIGPPSLRNFCATVNSACPIVRPVAATSGDSRSACIAPAARVFAFHLRIGEIIHHAADSLTVLTICPLNTVDIPTSRTPEMIPRIIALVAALPACNSGAEELPCRYPAIISRIKPLSMNGSISSLGGLFGSAASAHRARTRRPSRTAYFHASGTSAQIISAVSFSPLPFSCRPNNLLPTGSF